MKNLIGLLVLIALGSLAYYLYYVSPDTGNKENADLKEFAIEDTSRVNKIFMSRLDGQNVTLSRRGKDYWEVNNNYRAREDAIDLILKTAHDIEIQGPVSKTTFETVVKRLASFATKVEFYAGEDEPIKTWYVGHPTGTKVGTYMLLEEDGQKSSKPYITHMLMERGSLGTRFFLDSILWRDRAMLRANPKKIKSIAVRHFSDTLQSFKIRKTEENKFIASSIDGSNEQELHTDLAIPYFKLYSGIYYEYLDLKTPPTLLDSVFSGIPKHEAQIVFEDGKKVGIFCHNLPVPPGTTFQGKPITAHPERMYASSTELGPDVYCIVQNLTHDPLFPDGARFLSSKPVEK